MKKLSLIFLIGVLTVSCLKDKTTEEIDKNIAITKRLYDHFNKHEWRKMAALYSENAEFKDPSLGTTIVKQTHKQIIDKYTELNATFPDIHDKIIQIYPSGTNHVIVEFVSTGTAPDQSKFELPICTIFTIENGKITKDFTYYHNF